MFKYFLIIVFWCIIGRNDVYAQTDTSPERLPRTTAEESKKIGLAMHGYNNYHVAQQIFYIYDGQFFRRLLFGTKDSPFTSNQPSTYKFYPHKLNWNKARAACVQEGGHLAIINSDSEEKTLSRILQENNEGIGWLGLHDLYEEGDWITVTDVPLAATGYTKWTTRWPNEPDNYGGNQNCAILMKEDNAMDDIACDGLLHFICEFPEYNC